MSRTDTHNGLTSTLNDPQFILQCSTIQVVRLYFYGFFLSLFHFLKNWSKMTKKVRLTPPLFVDFRPVFHFFKNRSKIVQKSGYNVLTKNSIQGWSPMHRLSAFGVFCRFLKSGQKFVRLASLGDCVSCCFWDVFAKEQGVEFSVIKCLINNIKREDWVNLQIDLTDYSRLPNGLVSMFTSFSLTSARKGYVPLFCTNLFVVGLKLSHKLIFLTLLCTKCK